MLFVQWWPKTPLQSKGFHIRLQRNMFKTEKKTKMRSFHNYHNWTIVIHSSPNQQSFSHNKIVRPPSAAWHNSLGTKTCRSDRSGLADGQGFPGSPVLVQFCTVRTIVEQLWQLWHLWCVLFMFFWDFNGFKECVKWWWKASLQTSMHYLLVLGSAQGCPVQRSTTLAECQSIGITKMNQNQSASLEKWDSIQDRRWT